MNLELNFFELLWLYSKIYHNSTLFILHVLIVLIICFVFWEKKKNKQTLKWINVIEAIWIETFLLMMRRLFTAKAWGGSLSPNEEQYFTGHMVGVMVLVQ